MQGDTSDEARCVLVAIKINARATAIGAAARVAAEPRDHDVRGTGSKEVLGCRRRFRLPWFRLRKDDSVRLLRRPVTTTAIRLVAGPVERQLHREQYQALIDGLEESGITVFEEPSTETRGVPGHSLPSFAIAIYLVERFSGALLDEWLRKIRDVVVRTLRGAGPADTVRVVRVIGPDGSLLKDIAVP